MPPPPISMCVPGMPPLLAAPRETRGEGLSRDARHSAGPPWLEVTTGALKLVTGDCLCCRYRLMTSLNAGDSGCRLRR